MVRGSNGLCTVDVAHTLHITPTSLEQMLDSVSYEQRSNIVCAWLNVFTFSLYNLKLLLQFYGNLVSVLLLMVDIYFKVLSL